MFHQVNGIVVAVPYVRGSATSEAAAKSLTPATLNRMQRRTDKPKKQAK
jgi:hypothetical protein